MRRKAQISGLWQHHELQVTASSEQLLGLHDREGAPGSGRDQVVEVPQGAAAVSPVPAGDHAVVVDRRGEEAQAESVIAPLLHKNGSGKSEELRPYRGFAACG